MADQTVNPPSESSDAFAAGTQLDAAAVDALLADAGVTTPAAPTAAASAPVPAPAAESSKNIAENLVQSNASLQSVDNDLASAQASIDDLLRQANFEEPSASNPSEPTMPTTAFDLPDFQQSTSAAPATSIDLLKDVELDVKIELGRSRMLVEDVLKLVEGSVVELDKLAGDPVDVFVNDRLVARGEVLVLNDNFCVRVNEILAGVREEGL